MASLKLNEAEHLAEIEIDGYVDLASHNEIIRELEQAIDEDRGEWRLLEHIKHFCGLDPLAIIPNALFNIQNYSAFKRVAVVTDDRGLSAATMSLAPWVRPTQVRTYRASKIDDAREWLKESGQPSKEGSDSRPVERSTRRRKK